MGGKTRTWSTYPELHDQVSRLLADDDLFFDFGGTGRGIEEYDTNVMGRFACRNRACGSRAWTSKRIAITVRMYAGARYDVRVYHQRCKDCNRLSRPDLDESYAERTAYRLKKWCGVSVQPPPCGKKRGPPHESRLCEGCKVGHCSEL